jgi:hypothetical protein
MLRWGTFALDLKALPEAGYSCPLRVIRKTIGKSIGELFPRAGVKERKKPPLNRNGRRGPLFLK